MSETLVTQEAVESQETVESNDSQLESVTKETEDAFYGNSNQAQTDSQESASDEKAASSEDPSQDKVAKEEDAKAEDSTEEKKEEEQAVEYSLNLREGSLLGKGFLEDVESFAKENNLSNEVAQKVLDKQQMVLDSFIEAEANRHDKELEEWRQEVINDPTLGGDNLNKTAEDARRVVTRFGSEGFIQILKETGYGDHPEVVRFLSKLGSIMSEDSLILAKSGAKDKPLEDYFYKTN